MVSIDSFFELLASIASHGSFLAAIWRISQRPIPISRRALIISAIWWISQWPIQFSRRAWIIVGGFLPWTRQWARRTFVANWFLVRTSREARLLGRFRWRSWNFDAFIWGVPIPWSQATSHHAPLRRHFIIAWIAGLSGFHVTSSLHAANPSSWSPVCEHITNNSSIGHIFCERFQGLLKFELILSTVWHGMKFQFYFEMQVTAIKKPSFSSFHCHPSKPFQM